jgi:hypothetical protein
MPTIKPSVAISRKKLVKKILSPANANAVMRIQFVKKDGSLRDMVCRRGVREHKNEDGETVGLKGTGMSYDPKAKRLITVFDFQKQNYRMINELTLIEASINGTIYRVREAPSSAAITGEGL